MKNRQPLFHVVKREQAGLGRQALAYVAAVALAWLLQLAMTIPYAVKERYRFFSFGDAMFIS